MFCCYCGFSLPEDAAFCSSCGKALSPSPEQPAPKRAGAREEAGEIVRELMAKLPLDRLSKQDLSFMEVVGVLDDVQDALERARDFPDLHRELGDIRDMVLEKLDTRARELGKSDDWAKAKAGRKVLSVTGKLLRTTDGKSFWDAYKNQSPEERDALAATERQGLLDLKAFENEAKRVEPLRRALQSDSSGPVLFWALFRTSPYDAVKLALRSYRGFLLLLGILGAIIIVWRLYVAFAR